MPLPKKLLDAIDSAKDLPDEIRDALRNGVYFENDGEFLTNAEKRMKGKLGDADKRLAEAAKRAREEAINELVQSLGLTNIDEIDDVKRKLAAADGSLTEVEKAKGELKKLERDLKKATDTLAELSGFKVAVLKDRALSPHLDKINADAREEIRELFAAKLTLDGDKVTAPEGKDVAAFVDEWLKAKPFYKAPDYKDGAGTGPGGAKGKGDDGKGKPKADTAGAGSGAPVDDKAKPPANGTTPGPQDLAKTIAAVMAEKAAAANQGQSAGP